MENKTEGKTKITLALIISYIFTIVATFGAILALTDGGYTQAMAFASAAIISFPPFRARLAKDYNFTLSGGVVFVIAFGLFIYGTTIATKKGREARLSTQTPSAAETAPAEQMLEVKATVLSKEYKDNEVAADEKYRGKTIKITGTVETIGKDVLDKPYVALYAYEYAVMDHVQCYFTDADSGVLSQLKKGQKVTLQGEVNRKFGNILVNDCSVIN